MTRQRTACVLALLGILGQTSLPAQTASQDAELARGIRQVEDGELEEAVTTLDGVVRRLPTQRGAERDLATAHLYLAMAHLGLSRIEQAKAEVREAWKSDRRLVLDPKRYPPTIIKFFDEAKQDQGAAAPTPTAAQPPSTTTSGGKEGGKGGGKGILIALGVVGVGAGVAVAAGGGGGEAAPSPPPTTTPRPSGNVSVSLTLNGQTSGTFSCSDGLFVRIAASNSTSNTVQVNRFDLTFTSGSAACHSHAAPVDGSVIQTNQLASGASNVQLRQVDLGGDLCLPPNGDSNGCQWQANVVVQTGIGNFSASMQFATSR